MTYKNPLRGLELATAGVRVRTIVIRIDEVSSNEHEDSDEVPLQNYTCEWVNICKE